MNIFIKIGLIILAVLLIIQLVPFGHQHSNPPTTQEPPWDSPQTRALAARACFDCHSNETVWPWYSQIAPASWLIQNDVEEGRRALNFSEWGSGRYDVQEIPEVVGEGEMPPFYFAIMHPEARLTTQEKDDLIQGLTRTLLQ